MSRDNDPQAMQKYSLPLHSDRTKEPALLNWRGMTDAEILKLRYGDHVHVILNNNNGVGSVKINGKVRIWKRNPERIEVPVKWGLREFAVFSFTDCRARFLVAMPTNEKVYS